MAVTVQQIKQDIASKIDEAFEITMAKTDWPFTQHETVTYYDLMKLFQKLRFNLQKCLNNSTELKSAPSLPSQI